MPRVPTKRPANGSKAPNGAGKRAAPRKRPMRPYAQRAREYGELMQKLGLNQLECSELFEFADRTSRRYKRGEGKVPLPALKLMRLMARGVLTKRQVASA